MRIGLQVSADRGRYATKVEKLQADARWADEAGLDSVWTPQIPDEFDVMTAATLIGAATSRIEVGTAIVPLQPRHPIVLAQQALSNQAVCEGRFTWASASRTTGSFPTCSACPTSVRPRRCAATSTCWTGAAGPGLVEVENELFTIRHPFDVTDITPTPIMIAALGPVMLKLAGERAAGTSCGSPMSAPSRRMWSRRSRRRPSRRAGPPQGSWPACPSASAATTRSTPRSRRRTGP